jgi:hypothetical protein
MLRIIDEGVISSRPGRGAYMPLITRLADGTYVAAQHVGRSLTSADGHIELLEARDGRTFTPIDTNLADSIDAKTSCRGPEVIEVDPGRWMLVATRFQADDDNLFDPQTEALQRPEIVIHWSVDRGRIWSPPELVPVDLDPRRYTWNLAGRVLRPAEDRWLLFFETWKPAGWEGPPDQKAGLLVSRDRGRTWGEMTVVADDRSGRLLFWDQMGCLLPDGRIYNLLWTHVHGTMEDLAAHACLSGDQGRTWSTPRPTNLMGQVTSPIALADGRVAAIYNHRRDPQGIRVAITRDLQTFDEEVVVFDAGREATIGHTDSESFLAHHALIAFGKPAGHQEPDGTILTYFWCTSQGRTHTRWVRLRAD